MKILYEATIENYDFIMVNENTIEVWLNSTDEFPFSFINVGSGKIKNEKDFQKEISWWFMDNN